MARSPQISKGAIIGPDLVEKLNGVGIGDKEGTIVGLGSHPVTTQFQQQPDGVLNTLDLGHVSATGPDPLLNSHVMDVGHGDNMMIGLD